MANTASDLRLLLSEMPPSVRDFATYKSAIENCSLKTVSEYTLDLRTFFRYLCATRDGIPLDGEEFQKIDLRRIDMNFVSGIRTEHIYEFLLYAGDTRENAAAAKARKLSAIKAYFRYLTVKRHLLQDNPVANIESPKKKRTLPKYLSLSECEKLLEAVVGDAESQSIERDYAIITLFLNCGMRLSELVGIDLTDIDEEMRSLKVTGKGAKERIVYLNDACREALVNYLETRKDKKPEEMKSYALFLSSRDQRISPKTVQWMVGKYLRLAGLEYKGFSVHKLRHTAATLMYQSGKVDVRVLKDILGHEQLNTTQIYTHVSDESMEQAMYQNPVASLSVPLKSKKTDGE